MTLEEAMRTRHTVRRYSEKKFPKTFSPGWTSGCGAATNAAAWP